MQSWLIGRASLASLDSGKSRRIRLVAYGARLESVLGESPRGFESPILRHAVLYRHTLWSAILCLLMFHICQQIVSLISKF